MSISSCGRPAAVFLATRSSRERSAQHPQQPLGLEGGRWKRIEVQSAASPRGGDAGERATERRGLRQSLGRCELAEIPLQLLVRAIVVRPRPRAQLEALAHRRQQPRERLDRGRDVASLDPAYLALARARPPGERLLA